MPAQDTRLLLGRRPRTSQPAFGFVKASAEGRERLFETLSVAVRKSQDLTPADYHPDNIALDGEILVGNLDGMDRHFQQDASWSLERLVAEARTAGSPDWLTKDGIASGGWTFYAIGANVDGFDSILIRAQSASYGMKSKLMTVWSGSQLQLVDGPLLGFDGRADALVIDDRVFVSQPRQVERLFIDADAVKARAPKATAAFEAAMGADLSSSTAEAILKVCQQNANVARRVERLVRDGNLAKVTADSVRRSLSDADEPVDALGTEGPLVADNDRLAKLLVDLAADLYYQPRYASSPRRIAAYRNLKS